VSRERLARLVLEEGWKLGAAASRFSVSVKTAAKWVGRYRQFGTAGLTDRARVRITVRVKLLFHY